MIFLCFSSKDVQEPLREVLHYVEKYELPVLYDPMRLSSEDDYNLKSFNAGIERLIMRFFYLLPILFHLPVFRKKFTKFVHDMKKEI